VAKTPKTHPLKLFFGGEDYLLDRVRSQAREQSARIPVFFDAGECSEQEVISALGEITLDGTQYLVVLDNAEKWKKLPGLTQFCQSFVERPADNILHVILRPETMPKAWAPLTDEVEEFKKFKSWETEAILKRPVSEAEYNKLALDHEAEKLLLRMYSTDLALASSSLRKIKYLKLPSGIVTKDAILSVCTKQFPVFPWDVAEASFRSVKESLTYAAILFQQEGDDVAIPIVASLLKTTEQVYLSRTLYDKGKNSKDMATALSLNPYVFDKKFLPIVKKYSASELICRMQKLCKLEINVKGASLSKRTLVEATLQILTLNP